MKTFLAIVLLYLTTAAILTVARKLARGVNRFLLSEVTL